MLPATKSKLLGGGCNGASLLCRQQQSNGPLVPVKGQSWAPRVRAGSDEAKARNVCLSAVRSQCTTKVRCRTISGGGGGRQKEPVEKDETRWRQTDQGSGKRSKQDRERLCKANCTGWMKAIQTDPRRKMGRTRLGRQLGTKRQKHPQWMEMIRLEIDFRDLSCIASKHLTRGNPSKPQAALGGAFAWPNIHATGRSMRSRLLACID